MKGAIFFSTKYGSTAKYTNWISEATGLPAFNVKDDKTDPYKYDFLILGSPIIYMRLFIRKWVKRNVSILEKKPIIFFSVSGAGAGAKLDKWIAKSLPQNIVSKMKHVALLGRQKPEELNWFDRPMLQIASLIQSDPQASKDERYGFDYMDKSSIEPILKLVEQFQSIEA